MVFNQAVTQKKHKINAGHSLQHKGELHPAVRRSGVLGGPC